MAETHLHSSEAIFAAGYAMPLFAIATHVRVWRYRDEDYRTLAVPTVQNHGPDIALARIEDVRERAIG